MWSDETNWLALLELWSAGTLRRRKAQGEAWDELVRLPWTRRTGRRDVLALDDLHRPELEQLLDRAYPRWRDEREELMRRGLPVDFNGFRLLREQLRVASLPDELPSQLNQRTVAAAVAAHSKAVLSEDLRRTLGPIEVTRDGLVRLRPNPGLLISRGRESWPADKLAEVLGEVTLTERALRSGTRLTGAYPRAVLFAENVGFYIDVPVPEGWLVMQVPGWNTSTVRLILAQLATVPVIHCGDLDPEGVRIVAHLRQIRPDLRWAVPGFWEELIATRGLRKDWPPELELQGAPDLVKRLASEGIWLEQEPLALDPRFPLFLARLVDCSYGSRW